MGVAVFARMLEKYAKLPATVAAIAASLLCLLVPIQMVSQTWDDHDRSGRTVARDFGANYLESCEPNAIIFTNGDNDTFPLWYAQEVEGIRTDVRVCNTSYLQTDWYTDQMKRQAYESDPLPITWTREQYIMGTRDVVQILNVDPERFSTFDLGSALTMIRSDDPRLKRRVPGTDQTIDYIPSDKLVFPVDSAAVMRNNAISLADTSRLLKEMIIDLSGQTILRKEQITILDMLHTNNWERPMYYAFTVASDQYVRLDRYFQQTGMAFRITPIDVRGDGGRRIDTEKMYDNVMNKFKWGGADKPGIYLDENTMNMCRNYRRALFGDLAFALLEEGETEKAVAVLDKAVQVFPAENVPLDVSAIILAEAYLDAGEIEKGEQLLNGIADNSMRSIRWIYRLRPDLMLSVRNELMQHLGIMQHILGLGLENNPDFGQAYQDEFNNYRMMYMRQSANQ
jgi:hypothetical protein